MSLNPWEAKQVEFHLSKYDVSYWDVVSQDWVVPEGQFGIVVGKDSFDDSLVGSYCFSDSC